MHITEILKKKKKTYSFEYFPAKTEKAKVELLQVINELAEYKPDFVSVTYGAGGSTRELTHDLVTKIKQLGKHEPIPHLTCVCHQKNDIEIILKQYAKANIGNILALGGDPPKNIQNYNRKDDYFQHAIDLVKFIKDFNISGVHPNQKGFGIGVAGFPEGHPATPNRLKELDFLKEKVDAGADYIVTQLFFNNPDFYDFRERCQLNKINVPIIAGIMPINSLQGIQRMADLSGGTNFPAKLLKKILKYSDRPKEVEKIGIDYATQQSQDLIDNQVNGIHFYTLNKSHATKKIFKALNK